MSFECKWAWTTFAIATIWANVSTASDPITVVADEWPPFSGSELPGQGISIDVTRAVLERAGYQVQTAILPWARIVNGAQTGEHDIITSLFADPDMEKLLDYSAPFYTTEVKFIQRKGGAIEFDGLESLTPYSIAVGAGFLYSPAFDNADFLNKFEVTTTLQGIQMVAAGHIDLTLDSTDVLRHSIELGGPDLKEQLELMEPAVISQEIHMAVSRSRSDHAKIVADFNRTLGEMQSDGSLATLLEKHSVNQVD